MYKNISNQEFKQKVSQDPKAAILDVRTERECRDGIIRGARCLDMMASDFEASVRRLDKTRSYYIYCRSGNRSSVACRMMQDMGFKNLYNLEGGTLGWDGELVSRSEVKAS